MREAKPRLLRTYLTTQGRSPFDEWIAGLKDGKARGSIRVRLNRVAAGNLGDCRSVGGGVLELKIGFGPGYRVYFGMDGDLVILLGGGEKSTQDRDIPRAKDRWSDYNA